MDSATASTPKMLLDCDPGHDDAVAIAVAAHVGDLRGIVTVAGNAPIERTTHNALVVRDLLGIETPVHRGSARPILEPPRHAPAVHGESGLAGADLPAPTTPLDGTDGVAFIIESCRAEENLWLVPTGPLTNIALALRAAPDIVGRIAGVSLMGGGSFGNRTAVAESNIRADPHAAAIVFSTFDADPPPGRLIMAGLDVTYRFQATPERIAQVRDLPGRFAQTIGELFAFYSGGYLERHDEGTIRGAPLHDPLAVLAVSHSHLFEHRNRHVAVETEGRLTAGMTVIDERKLRERPDANCDVLVDVDADAAFEVVLDAFRAGATRTA